MCLSYSSTLLYDPCLLQFLFFLLFLILDGLISLMFIPLFSFVNYVFPSFSVELVTIHQFLTLRIHTHFSTVGRKPESRMLYFSLHTKQIRLKRAGIFYSVLSFYSQFLLRQFSIFTAKILDFPWTPTFSLLKQCFSLSTTNVQPLLILLWDQLYRKQNSSLSNVPSLIYLLFS